MWQQYAAKPGLSGATLGSLAYATISEKDLSLADLEALYRQSDGRTRVTFLRGLPVGEFEGQLEFLKEYSALSEPAHLTASYRHWTESREPSLLVRSLVDAYEQRDKLAEEQVREVAEVFNSLIEDWKADPSDLLAARNILLKWADELSEPTRSEIRSLLEI